MRTIRSEAAANVYMAAARTGATIGATFHNPAPVRTARPPARIGAALAILAALAMAGCGGGDLADFPTEDTGPACVGTCSR